MGIHRCALETPVTFTRDNGESSGSPCVRIYACWSRLGPHICLTRGPTNGGSPPLAIVVCSLLLSSLFRTRLNLFVCPASSAKPSSPFSNDQAAQAFHQPSQSASAFEARTETVTIPLFSGHFPLQYPSIHPSLECSRTPDPAGEVM
jgi:hypothetical protein